MKSLLLPACVLGLAAWMSTTALAAVPPERQPDSLTRVLDLGLPPASTEEIRGQQSPLFRLQSSAERSVISWRDDQVLYTYALEGSNHASLGLQWFTLITRHGLRGFVADRAAPRKDFLEVRRVHALEVWAGTRGN